MTDRPQRFFVVLFSFLFLFNISCLEKSNEWFSPFLVIVCVLFVWIYGNIQTAFCQSQALICFLSVHGTEPTGSSRLINSQKSGRLRCALKETSAGFWCFIRSVWFVLTDELPVAEYGKWWRTEPDVPSRHFQTQRSQSCPENWQLDKPAVMRQSFSVTAKQTRSCCKITVTKKLQITKTIAYIFLVMLYYHQILDSILQRFL